MTSRSESIDSTAVTPGKVRSTSRMKMPYSSRSRAMI
ncbi:transposase [Caballeronia zhejiangensis]|uniref:Transposase n=1 Tax=Caballeronia zhejiangensis TaxID=871203 RepID=A0A656QK94_9BURK|nr:transposase [Caballeronia zhejiangensis]